MNCPPPTSRFCMGTWHQVQSRSGISGEGSAFALALSDRGSVMPGILSRRRPHVNRPNAETAAPGAEKVPAPTGLPRALLLHSPSMSGVSLGDFFRNLPGKLDAEAAEGLDAVFQFDLSGPEGGQYYLVVNEKTCQVGEGTHPSPHVTITMSGEDCVRVLTGQLDGPAVLTSGRLRIDGDLSLAIQLKMLFPTLH